MEYTNEGIIFNSPTRTAGDHGQGVLRGNGGYMSFRSFPKSRRNKSGSEAKIGNTHSTCKRGHSHRSKLETAVCELISLREYAGEIRLLQVEDHLYLSEARIGYVADFRCVALRDFSRIIAGTEFWVEAKGFANDRWPILKKLYSVYGFGPLELWTGHWKNPVLSETIFPKRMKRCQCEE